jgi:hypothetical protein
MQITAKELRPLDFLSKGLIREAIAAFNAEVPSSAPPSPSAAAASPHPTQLMEALTDRPVPHSGALIPGGSRRLPKLIPGGSRRLPKRGR